MRVHYETTFDDLLAFNAYHNRQSPTARRVRLFGTYLPPLILTVAVLPGFVETSGWLGFFLLWLPLMGLLAFILAYLFRFVTKLQVRKMLQEGGTGSVIGERTVELSEEYLIDRGAYGESKVRWSNVERVEQTEDHLFLYTSAICAHIIPRRAFRDADRERAFLREVEEFRTLTSA
jgi:hypothetical protein